MIIRKFVFRSLLTRKFDTYVQFRSLDDNNNNCPCTFVHLLHWFIMHKQELSRKYIIYKNAWVSVEGEKMFFNAEKLYINMRRSKLGIWVKGMEIIIQQLSIRMSGGLFERTRLRGMWCMSMGSLRSMGSLKVCIKKKEKNNLHMHIV